MTLIQESEVANVRFDLDVPQLNSASVNHSISSGEILFVLGANGTGKSSLMQRFHNAHHYSGNVKRISAHRQTWFSSNAITLSPEQKRQTESSIQGNDTTLEARWMDHYPAQRASIAIYDLIDAENVRAREITAEVDRDNIALAKMLSKKDAPVKIINDLLRLSNIPVEISVHANEQVVASKAGGPTYSIAELSDGERNALLIAADVLTAKKNSLILVDEPERHLHRSIISPLLTLLFAQRADCVFVVSTHDVMLPLDNASAYTLLIRGCTYAGQQVTAWEVDLVSPESVIDDKLKKDILGSRRKLLFIEGEEESLDKSLYSLIFPNVSIVAKASCRSVEHAVFGIREAGELHWVNAFGIVDNDRRTLEDIERLKDMRIFALPIFSVESIYYHPEIQRRVAERHAKITESDAQVTLAEAQTAALTAIERQVQHLSERMAEKLVRRDIFQHLPTKRSISSKSPISISIDVSEAINKEEMRLRELLIAGDLSQIIEQYPIRETGALGAIARALGFQNPKHYQGAVRKLLMDDESALTYVQSLFNDLSTAIYE